MNRYLFAFIFLSLFITHNVPAQNRLTDQKDIREFLYSKYRKVETSSIAIKQIEMLNTIQKIIGADSLFRLEELGKSFEGRSINLIRIGTGTKKVLLWSQMHGDEPTATLAIFDILVFLRDNQTTDLLKNLLSKIEILFIPMLNPDGAEKFSRRNAQGIDINRDALRLQTPEGRILKKTRDRFNPEFAFNLHDQSPYSSVGDTDSLAALALLAPAFDEQKNDNEVRLKAKKMIVYILKSLQKYLPGKISKYSDEFEKRAFGDNVQLWGSSTILIESGGYIDDPGKEYLRKMNYMALLSSFFAFADDSYNPAATSEYDSIAFNKRTFCDLLISNSEIVFSKGAYIADIAINLDIDASGVPPFYKGGRISDIGDLTNLKGIKKIEGTGYKTFPGKYVLVNDLSELEENTRIIELCKNGVTTIITGKPVIENRKNPFQIIQISDIAFSMLKSKFDNKYFSVDDLYSDSNFTFKEKNQLNNTIQLMKPANLFLTNGSDIILVIEGIVKFANGILINP